MSLRLTDSLGNFLDLDNTFTLSGDGWGRRTQATDTAYAHGGRNLSDKMVKIRKFKITGIIKGATETAYIAAKDALNLWLYKKDLKLSYDGNRYINIIEISDIGHSFAEGGFNRIAKVTLTLDITDPFWYAFSSTVNSQVITSSPFTFSVNNSGSIEVNPIITFTATANNPDFILTNNTDGGRAFRIQDTGFFTNDIIIVDCVQGIVTRNGTNIINLFDGIFLQLLSGLNIIYYTGSNVNISTVYQVRYL